MSVRDPFRAFWHRHLRDPAWWCGWFTLAAGLWLLLPFESLSPPWFLLGQLLPESWWGLALLAIGVWQVAAVTLSHAPLLCETTFACFLAWSFVSYVTVQVAPMALSSVIYPSLALMCCTAFLRIRSDVWGAVRKGPCTGV